MENPEKAKAVLGSTINGTQVRTESDTSVNQSPVKSDVTSNATDEEVDLMKVFYDKEPKSTELRISCTICGDKASGFHYGVHACEGCKGFFRRTVRMRLKYKECAAGCKVNVKTRNKCQYCRFQKCIKSGMSHDAIRFGRMSRVEKKKIISKMAREEPELLSRKRFEEEEKLKNLTETLSNAFQEHLSITRSKMVALWQKRDMPGVVSPQIASLEDVKSLYPILKGNIQENTDGPTYSTEGTSQSYDGNQNPISDKRSDDALAFAFLEDMSFSSSSSSDSDSDELLHAVKKTTIPYPNYKHEGKIPQLPSLYQGTLVSSMDTNSEAFVHMNKQPPAQFQAATGSSGDNTTPDALPTNSDSCYSSGSEQHDTPPHSSTSPLINFDLSSLPLPNNLEKMFSYLPDLKLVFAKAGITLTDVTKHAQANSCSVLDAAFHLLRDERVKIKLERQLGLDKPLDASESAQKSQMAMPRPPNQMVGLKVMRFLYQRFQKRLVKGVCELTEYSKKIPGFTSLVLSDQVILLKYGSYEALFVLLGAMIFQKGMLLPDGNLFVTYDFVFKLGEVGQIMRPKFEFAEKIASLNLYDKDFALFIAAIILFGDRPGLCDRQKVEAIQSDILRALELQLKNSHPNNPQLFAKLLLKMTDLRQLVADHVQMTECLANIRSMKKLFHPLVSELLSDRE